MAGPANLETINGSIEIFVSDELDADIELETTNGKVSLNEVDVFTEESSPGYVKGWIGDGGDEIHAETSNGNVNLRYIGRSRRRVR
jgi:DUF4097 and DUF4098 domain-containing protein YvlB